MRRSTWVFLALVLAALLLIFLWERKRPSTTEKEEGALSLLPELPKAEEITRMERAGGEPIVLAKSGENWRLLSPVADDADKYSVEGFLDRLREAKAIRFVAEPAPWGEMGLEKPEISWKITSASGSWEVALGGKPPLEEGLYIKAGKRAALVSADLEPTLRRAASEFRSKDLLSEPSSDIQAFEVRQKGLPPLAAKKYGESWRLLRPFEDEADTDKVEAFLDDLGLATISSFHDGPPAPEHALEDPRIAVSLTLEKGKGVEVKIGADVAAPKQGGEGAVPDESRAYVTVTGRPSVMAVSSRFIKALEGAPEALRSLALFGRDPFELEELRADGAYTAVMRRDPDGKWGFEPPTKAPKGKDAAPVAESLLSLKGLSAVPATDLAGLDLLPPYVTLTLKGKGFEEKVSIGIERDGKRYARPGARPVALALDAEEWRRAEDSLKAIPLAPEAPSGKKQ